MFVFVAGGYRPCGVHHVGRLRAALAPHGSVPGVDELIFLHESLEAFYEEPLGKDIDGRAYTYTPKAASAYVRSHSVAPLTAGAAERVADFFQMHRVRHDTKPTSLKEFAKEFNTRAAPLNVSEDRFLHATVVQTRPTLKWLKELDEATLGAMFGSSEEARRLGASLMHGIRDGSVVCRIKRTDDDGEAPFAMRHTTASEFADLKQVAGTFWLQVATIIVNGASQGVAFMDAIEVRDGVFYRGRSPNASAQKDSGMLACFFKQLPLSVDEASRVLSTAGLSMSNTATALMAQCFLEGGGRKAPFDVTVSHALMSAHGAGDCRIVGAVGPVAMHSDEFCCVAVAQWGDAPFKTATPGGVARSSPHHRALRALDEGKVVGDAVHEACANPLTNAPSMGLYGKLVDA